MEQLQTIRNNSLDWTRIFFTVYLCVIFFSFTPEEGLAGREDKAGSAAASELMIPLGATSIGSGSSNLAFVSGVDALYWNPAGVARSPFHYHAMFSHMNYFANIGVDYFAGIARIEDVATIGVSAKILSLGDIPITTSDQPDGTGQTTSPAFVVLSGALSRMITDKISFGLTANYIIEKMEQVSASGIAFTAGLQYAGLGGIDGLSMGVLVRNVGPKIQFDGDGLVYTGELDDMLRPPGQYKIESSSDDLPSTIEIGLSYRQPVLDDAVINWSAAFQNNNFSADEYKTGVEVLFQNQFAIRLGYIYSASDTREDYIFGPTFGLGLLTVIENIEFQFDYGYRTLRYFSNNHVITIQAGVN